MTPDAKTGLLLIGAEHLDALTRDARATPRRRRNFDIHRIVSHPAQRLLNAVEPDSYIRPHRHVDPLKEETFFVLRGAFGLVLFDERGEVAQTAVLRAGGDAIGANVPVGTFHCLIALEPGSVFFEAKAGPYDPATDKDWPQWAPPEGDSAAADYLARLRRLFR
jgi:cupin fold WbuC family metalloprotein